MGDVDQHPLGSDLLAADFFFERVKQLVHLDRKRARLGLALSLAGCLYLQLGQVVAAHGVRQDDVDHGLAQRAIADDQFDVHFGLSAQLGDTEAKGTAVDPDSLAQGVIAVENGAKFEREYRGVAETVADHAGMIDCCLMVQFTGCVVVLAHNHSEFATGITQDRSAINALNALKQERAASAGAIWEGLMFSKTVRVPRHVELSEPGWRQTGPPLTSSFSPKLVQRVMEVGNGRYWAIRTGDS